MTFSIEALTSAWNRLDAAVRKIQSAKMSEVSETLHELELARKNYAHLQRLIPHHLRLTVPVSDVVNGGNTFGERLLYWRSKVQLTQLELANLSGVSLPQLTRYETGRSTPRLGAVMKLAKALNIEIEALQP
ncbi:helix-turn-helix domain-containing protein [Pseudomonas sp. NPDC096950]|uniref:helix-turn-helix domain-containing protein n=1 Tax=Pseudomonas sp. NPDC096950 TaxID=3364485 RepID=UPI00383BCB97